MPSSQKTFPPGFDAPQANKEGFNPNTDAHTASSTELPESQEKAANHSSTSAQDTTRVPWRCGDPYSYAIPKKEDPWEYCQKLIQEHDKDMCDNWKEEVDKLLIFAGLFSAAVTAFTIESYQWLQENPNDASIQLLTQVTSQLVQNTLNSSSPFFIQEPFAPSPSAIRINILWFLSLTFSLATVLIGILCMQWLREYQRNAALPNKNALALRQMRYEGLMKWHVPRIVSSLPLILQSAVVIFFAGLLDLLWDLNKAVAIVITIAVSSVLVFLAITTMAPFFQYFLLGDKHFQTGQCPYKSPQSWAFYWLGLNTLWVFTYILQPLLRSRPLPSSFLKLKRSLYDQNWIEYDVRQWQRLRNTEDVIHGLSWLDRTFTRNVDVVYSIYHCLLDLKMRTAARVVSNINPNAADRLHEILEEHNDMTPSVVQQKMENISTLFLEHHQRTHPVLISHYLESIVRILNTQDVQPFIDWPIGNLLRLPNDIVEQFLMCIRLMITRERVTPPHVITIWAIVQRIMILNRETTNLAYIELGFGIISDFEAWLSRHSQLVEVKHKVGLCVYGMIQIFKPSINHPSIWADYPGFTKAVELVRTLDGYVTGLGNATFLEDVVYQQWAALVKNCSLPSL